MNMILTHWKTTVSSVLTVLIATGTYFMAVPSTIISQKWATIITIVVGLAKVWLGLVQQDAGVVVATTPANPTPHAEPAHEVPDSPAAQPVVPKP